mmetsp:Transcript_34103/g.85025  ORF Transcript_34103/g.85025 Transcript_34103/m.85025 type:complete len:306 (-) Transcript_34103:528-1445(-)
MNATPKNQLEDVALLYHLTRTSRQLCRPHWSRLQLLLFCVFLLLLGVLWLLLGVFGLLLGILWLLLRVLWLLLCVLGLLLRVLGLRIDVRDLRIHVLRLLCILIRRGLDDNRCGGVHAIRHTTFVRCVTLPAPSENLPMLLHACRRTTSLELLSNGRPVAARAILGHESFELLFLLRAPPLRLSSRGAVALGLRTIRVCKSRNHGNDCAIRGRVSRRHDLSSIWIRGNRSNGGGLDSRPTVLALPLAIHDLPVLLDARWRARSAKSVRHLGPGAHAKLADELLQLRLFFRCPTRSGSAVATPLLD